MLQRIKETRLTYHHRLESPIEALNQIAALQTSVFEPRSCAAALGAKLELASASFVVLQRANVLS